MMLIQQSTRVVKVAILFLLAVVILSLLNNNLEAQSSSTKLTSNKLKMAKNISKSFNNQNIQVPEQYTALFIESNSKLKEAQQLAIEEQWLQADVIISSVIKDLMYIRTKSKASLSSSCTKFSYKLLKTAKLLINIFDTSETTSTNETNILSELRTSSTSLKINNNNEKQCKQLQLTISKAISTIEGRYKNNTAVVKLDLSTAVKRYQYDVNRFNTYDLLLQKKLRSSTLKTDARLKISALVKQAYETSKKAHSIHKTNNSEQAEILQIQANSKLLKALRITGLYLPE